MLEGALLPYGGRTAAIRINERIQSIVGGLLESRFIIVGFGYLGAVALTYGSIEPTVIFAIPASYFAVRLGIAHRRAGTRKIGIILSLTGTVLSLIQTSLQLSSFYSVVDPSSIIIVVCLAIAYYLATPYTREYFTADEGSESRSRHLLWA